MVEDLVQASTVLPLTGSTTLLALQGVSVHGLSFWDSLIWAVARENHVTVIHTEDLPGITAIEGVTYTSPFAAPA